MSNVSCGQGRFWRVIVNLESDHGLWCRDGGKAQMLVPCLVGSHHTSWKKVLVALRGPLECLLRYSSAHRANLRVCRSRNRVSLTDGLLLHVCKCGDGMKVFMDKTTDPSVQKN
jgi:hypothetical protein